MKNIKNLVESIIFPFLSEETIHADISLVPGGFKPPHAGHFAMIQYYASISNKVIILLSDATPRFLPNGRKVTGKISKALFTAYFKAYNIKNVEIRILTKSPVAAVFDFLSEEAKENQTIVLGVSSKDDDQTRYRPAAIEKYNTQHANVQIIPYKPVAIDGKNLSASDMRKAIGNNDVKTLASFLPDKLKSKASQILDVINKNLVEEKMPLTEGGGAGHLLHPYEDLDLSFNDIKQMIDGALAGKLNLMTEKVDGLNLMVSWKNNHLIGARNKGHLKNNGETALTVDQMKAMFAGRGNIETSFVESMNDLSQAIKQLTPEDRTNFFGEGKRFLNLEVMHPDTENVIPYGATQLVFHHFREYDEMGNEIKQDHEGVKQLEQKLNDLKASKQKTFQIKTLQPAQVMSAIDPAQKIRKYYRALSALKKNQELSDNSTIRDYLTKRWNAYIAKYATNMNVTPTPELLNLLRKRWVDGDKTVNIKKLMSMSVNSSFLSWISETDKSSKEISTQMIQPFETLILNLGVDVLRGFKNLSAINPDNAASQIKSALQQTLQKIKDSDDKAGMELVQQQLKRLNAIGGIESILPSEGIVFTYNNKLYKLTGAFAPVNRILGYLKFKN